MIAKEYTDPEFGIIPIKRIPRAKYVRVRVTPRGTLAATMPSMAPVRLLGTLVDKSRLSLRKALEDNQKHAGRVYADGDMVGTSHRIQLQEGARASARRREQVIAWTIPLGTDYRDEANQDTIRRAVRKALDEQANAYLPRRLQYLADMCGLHFSKIRYSNAKGRWGSCSTQGVISLNVALMNIPKEVIDYVLIHELAHTKHMNHSSSFWDLVESHYPDYKAARKQLKTYSPYL